MAMARSLKMLFMWVICFKYRQILGKDIFGVKYDNFIKYKYNKKPIYIIMCNVYCTRA